MLVVKPLFLVHPIALALSLALPALGATFHVDVNSTSPAPPYASWATAATTIQAAVDTANAGDQILVTNGVYQTGGSLANGGLTNRVSVTKPVTVRSVNGPAVTLIVGYQVPGSIYGSDAVRCVYLTNGAALFGFTITNGGTVSINSEPPDVVAGGGGVYCESITAVVSNCIMIGNAGGLGGGVYGGTVKNCSLIGNTSGGYGGGAFNSMLFNCWLTRNRAGWGAGGAMIGGLNNCTVTDNFPSGIDSSAVTNSIVFYNSPQNYAGSYWEPIFHFSCTAPLPANGTGNLSTEPQLASASHLSAGSPCRSAGIFSAVSGVDIDREAWGNPPAMGCDEYYSGATTGPLNVTLQASLTNVAVGFPVNFTASVIGACSVSRWDFGDGTTLSNQPFATVHHWAAAGDYAVVLTAYNESHPGGMSATSIVHVAEENHYVSLTSPNPVSPYSSWATAATNIQDAVDAAVLPGALVLVSNGVYAAGGRSVYGSMTNRVAVHKPVAVRSVNGPLLTTIQGYQLPGTTNGDGAIRCVYLTSNATLSGFTLTGGATRAEGDGGSEQSGGGVSSESVSAVVSNCVITGNAAAYLGGGASGGLLINCVLATNQASVGGAVYASTAINCAITNNTAGDQGGGAYAATLDGCVILSNYAPNAGGGLSGCTVSNSVLSANTSASGGGAYESTLRNCVLTNNSASSAGGGVYGGTLTACVLSGNTTLGQGGGVSGATLNACSLSGNNAASSGGGAMGGVLNNCALTGNSAGYSGGGVSGATLNNCTITGNAASVGGGAESSTLNNTILFYNTAGRGLNYSGGSFNYCCTTPLPSNGAGNITAEPQLAGPAHLSATSPCRGAGNATYATGTDIDGQLWLSPPAIGCDEFYSAPVTGALSVAIQATYTNIAVGYADSFAAQIVGHPTASRWEFGDGTIVSNLPFASHAWAAAGDYEVVLRAYNNSNPGGVSATVTVHVVTQPVHYVALNNPSPVAPFTSWATAATNIQDAVNAATLPGALVLVTNGIYQSGGQVVFGAMTNRVVINKPILVQSANGPAVTVIQGTPTNGDTAVRCAYVSTGAKLSGFTLTRGATRADGDGDREQSGGAAWCESTTAVLSNCVLTANTAHYLGGAVVSGTLINCTLATNSASSGGAVYLSDLYHCTLTRNVAAGDSGGAAHSAALNNCSLGSNAAVNTGGGAYSSSLVNCTLSGNSATNYGGGANASSLNNCALFGNSSGSYGGGVEGCVLNNCTLTGNSALNGGGAHSSTLNNCIVYFNSAPLEANHAASTLNYCCTTPLPLAGAGNISTDPQLAGFTHLSSGSPCRSAGSASYASGTDIDGDSWANPPSIGCDEYQVGALTGSLSVGIQATQTNTAVGFVASFTAQLDGRVSDSRWEFGDGTIVSNQPYASHAWAAPGDFPVVLRAYNESNPGGVTATIVVHVITQPVHYVRVSGSTPVAPYSSWATAANNIQSAVDAANVAGALVLVSNGTYQTGGRVVIEATNRVAVTKPLVVQSVNGPTVTSINGSSVMRCAYVAGGAIMSGFTFANGVVGEMVDASERNGGGVRCASLSAVLTNCVVTGCSGTGGGGGVFSGTLKNCTLSGNSISYGGGGVSSAILDNCMFMSNSAWAGGATSGSTLNNCTLIGNGAWYGGGVDWSALSNCVLTANTGGNGGAANNATLNFCLLTNNTAQYWGGGALNGTLVNCTLIGNYAASGGAALDATLRNCRLYANSAGHGGGTVGGTLYNCTVTGNSAGSGGGADGSTLNNCIVYYNNAPVDSNYTASCTLNYSCASPPPASGTGNVAADPQLASLTQISAASPCRGAGSAVYVSATDIDGEPWLSPPSIGCDEYYSGGLTGLITVAFQANDTNVATGIPVRLTSTIGGLVTASRWEFGDGTIVSNQPAVTHIWSAAGDYNVVLRVYNETYPTGVTTNLTVYVLVSPVHYVAVNNSSPVPPYLSWATAATNIQDAVDAAYTGGIIVVANGVYSTGSRVVSGYTNRVALTRPMTLQSLGGPAVTVINGMQAMRGVYLAKGTALLGFTVTNGTTSGDGGGVLCELPSLIISNCVLTGNSAASGSGGGVYGGTIKNSILRANSGVNGAGAANATLYDCELLNNSGAHGGGAYSSTLNRCWLSGNYAYSPHTGGGGGGAYGSTLNSCLVISNSAPIWGGGAYGSTLNSCTVVGNYGGQRGAGIFEGTARNSILYDNYKFGGVIENFGARYWWWVTLNYCCTTPIPASGGANFTNAPVFLNLPAGNFRLQSNSPCINAGYNGYVASITDLDGYQRIHDGTVDLGAYEFIPPDLAAFYQWLQSHGLPADGSADYTDTDSDGMNNWQEYLAGTVPTDDSSVLRMLSPTSDVGGIVVSWQSVATRNYFLQRSTNLLAQPAFSTLQSNIVGEAGATIYTDTSAVGNGPFFYRVGVEQ